VNDLLEVTSVVIAALERAGVLYTVGGSLASSFSGEPRSSIDADILVDLTAEQIPVFLQALGDAFYADADALKRAATSKTTTNLIHRASGIKVDLFVARSPLDSNQLRRRRAVSVSVNPPRQWFVHSPEDILLQKLLWYRDDGEVSDRQWRDVLAILLVQGGRLDRDYVVNTARSIGVDDLLERAAGEAAHGA